MLAVMHQEKDLDGLSHAEGLHNPAIGQLVGFDSKRSVKIVSVTAQNCGIYVVTLKLYRCRL